MACLLVLVLVVAATVPPGKLTHAAVVTTSPAEAFWRTALPDAPMPEAIRELLRHGSEIASVIGDALNFKYTEYDKSSSSPRNQAAAPSPEVLTNRRVVTGAPNPNTAASSSSSPTTVLFLEDAVRVGGILPVKAPADSSSSSPLRLYTVRAVRAVDGRRFVVCRRRGGDREAGPGDGAVYGCRATGPAASARAYVVGVVGDRGETVTAAVVCRTTGSGMMMPRGNKQARASFWLLDGVKSGGGGGGGAAAVCQAAIDALVIPVKDDGTSSPSLV